MNEQGHRLIDRLIDAELSVDEIRDLHDLVETDQEIQERLTEELDLVGDLHYLSFSQEQRQEFEESTYRAIDTMEHPTRNTGDDVMQALRRDRDKSRIIRLVWRIAASLVICAGLVWQFALRPVELSGSIASIQEPGKGFEVHRGQNVIAATKDTALKSGDLIISSQPDQRLAFKFSDGSKVALFKGGSIRVQEYRRKGKRLSLETGKAAFKVTPQEKPFRVTTQHGAIQVVGTAFSVATSESAMNVNVTEGVIEIASVTGNRITVQAGEQAVASKGAPDIRYWVALPAGIPALVAWYDAADTSTIIESGGTVSQWHDKSGNGYNYSQGTGSAQPATGVTNIGGLNAIRFDGTSDYMQNASDITFVDKIVIGVLKREPAPKGAVIFGGLRANKQVGFKPSGQQRIAAKRNNWVNEGEDNVTATDLSVTATPSVYGWEGGNPCRFYKDGIQSSITDARENAKAWGMGMLGCFYHVPMTGFFRGDIGELVVCPSTISTNDRQIIEGYLAHKWGLTANLPADHPYKAHPPGRQQER